MTKNEITTNIKSVVENIIHQQIYTLINDLEDNEFSDRVVDETYETGVFIEDHYEITNGELIDMEDIKVKDFINYLTEKWVTRLSVNETPKHNWSSGE